MNFFQFAALILMSCAYANAYITSGKCIPVPVVSNFDATKYAGRWFAIQRLPSTFESGLKCVTADYGLLNATTLSLTNKGIKYVKYFRIFNFIH